MKPTTLVLAAVVVVGGAIAYQAYQAKASKPPGSGLNFGFNFSKFGN